MMGEDNGSQNESPRTNSIHSATSLVGNSDKHDQIIQPPPHTSSPRQDAVSKSLDKLIRKSMSHSRQSKAKESLQTLIGKFAASQNLPTDVLQEIDEEENVQTSYDGEGSDAIDDSGHKDEEMSGEIQSLGTESNTGLLLAEEGNQSSTSLSLHSRENDISEHKALYGSKRLWASYSVGMTSPYEDVSNHRSASVISLPEESSLQSTVSVMSLEEELLQLSKDIDSSRHSNRKSGLTEFLESSQRSMFDDDESLSKEDNLNHPTEALPPAPPPTTPTMSPIQRQWRKKRVEKEIEEHGLEASHLSKEDAVEHDTFLTPSSSNTRRRRTQSGESPKSRKSVSASPRNRSRKHGVRVSKESASSPRDKKSQRRKSRSVPNSPLPASRSPVPTTSDKPRLSSQLRKPPKAPLSYETVGSSDIKNVHSLSRNEGPKKLDHSQDIEWSPSVGSMIQASGLPIHHVRAGSREIEWSPSREEQRLELENNRTNNGELPAGKTILQEDPKANFATNGDHTNVLESSVDTPLIFEDNQHDDSSSEESYVSLDIHETTGSISSVSASVAIPKSRSRSRRSSSHKGKARKSSRSKSSSRKSADRVNSVPAESQKRRSRSKHRRASSKSRPAGSNPTNSPRSRPPLSRSPVRASSQTRKKSTSPMRKVNDVTELLDPVATSRSRPESRRRNHRDGRSGSRSRPRASSLSPTTEQRQSLNKEIMDATLAQRQLKKLATQSPRASKTPVPQPSTEGGDRSGKTRRSSSRSKNHPHLSRKSTSESNSSQAKSHSVRSRSRSHSRSHSHNHRNARSSRIGQGVIEHPGDPEISKSQPSSPAVMRSPKREKHRSSSTGRGRSIDESSPLTVPNKLPLSSSPIRSSKRSSNHARHARSSIELNEL